MNSRSLTATEASSIAIIGLAVLWRWPSLLMLVPALIVAPVVIGLVLARAGAADPVVSPQEARSLAPAQARAPA